MASGFFRKTMVFLGLDDEELDDYDAAYESEVAVAPRRFPTVEPEPIPQPQLSGVRPIPRDPTADPSGGMPVPTVRRRVAVQASPKVHVVAPERFADAQEIADHFKGNQPVIVNLQGLTTAGEGGEVPDRALARRMIDFCSGVTYALAGSMDRVADQVFLLTPSNVEVSAEEKRRLKDQGLYRT